MDTGGIQINTPKRWLAEVVELLSSMRFAISLLVIIAIASVVGTVVLQNEPMVNYVNQFGPFWFGIFNDVGIYNVYGTWWFLCIMGLLVISTSLCIIRNAPKFIKDVSSWKESVQEKSLQNMPQHFSWQSEQTPAQLLKSMTAYVVSKGYRARQVQKEKGILLTAKRGGANRWGYIFAHLGIIVICLGGLLDSGVAIRLQEWLFNKSPFMGSGRIADVAVDHRLSIWNPSYRGNTMISEGAASSTTVLPSGEGVLIQDLPITIALKKFVIDFYSTGMPRKYTSDVVVTDHATGKSMPATIEVNKPFIYNGIAIYQSGFDDGGSRLKTTAYPMMGDQTKTEDISGKVNDATPYKDALSKHQYSIEWTGFRMFNIENMPGQNADPRSVAKTNKIESAFDQHTGASTREMQKNKFKNLGPSIQYKLRDQAGQAREFMTYMQPIEIDGINMFVTGVRDTSDAPMRYLRIPADDEYSLKEWMRLRAALMNPAMREAAAQRYAASTEAAQPAAGKQLEQQLAQSALQSLVIFAGTPEQTGGYIGISQFLQKIPKENQAQAADLFMRVLNGSMWQLWQVAREHDRLKDIDSSEKHAQFLRLSMNALSDNVLYKAPVLLQLDSFEQVQASVFQITKSPGKKVVYLGCLFLVLGVFAMLYIRERRLWIWVKQDDKQQTQATLAMSTQRKTLDFEKEFEQIQQQILSK